MEVGLDINNILSQNEVDNLFNTDENDTGVTTEAKTEEVKQEPDENNEKQNKATEEEIDVNNLFDTPENVGGKEINDQKKAPSNPDGSKSSPKPNFYTSTLSALVNDGVFTGLSDDEIAGVADDETFKAAVQKEVESRLDETNKRINDALNYGVDADSVKQNEAISNFLNGVSDEDISDETDKGVKLRRDLIGQDLLNKGFTQEQVQKKLDIIFDSGSDISEAQDALENNKVYYRDSYNKMLEDRKKEREEEIKRLKDEDDNLHKSLTEGKDLLGGLQLDNNTREKIYSNITKPVYKDKETGETLTAIQKYQRENRADFAKNIGILYTLTDGFKNIDALVKSNVRKEVKSHLKELEHTLNNTSRNNDGSYNYTSGVDDTESSIGAGWKLDI